jgi:hypothetical protein
MPAASGRTPVLDRIICWGWHLLDLACTIIIVISFAGVAVGLGYK